MFEFNLQIGIPHKNRKVQKLDDLSSKLKRQCRKKKTHVSSCVGKMYFYCTSLHVLCQSRFSFFDEVIPESKLLINLDLSEINNLVSCLPNWVAFNENGQFW